MTFTCQEKLFPRGMDSSKVKRTQGDEGIIYRERDVNMGVGKGLATRERERDECGHRSRVTRVSSGVSRNLHRWVLIVR